ncbi:MAG: hypothetical protein JWL88_299 [Parcubacteria group bacterium]|nr:hypothetical protein [Parcubacteria group bacterium]
MIDYPDLPGAFAIGKTKNEALENGDTCVKVWLARASEMGFKPASPGTGALHSGLLRFRVPRTLHRNISIWSEKQQTSLNDAVNQLIVRAIVRQFGSSTQYEHYLTLFKNRSNARRQSNSPNGDTRNFSGNWMQRLPPIISQHVIVWADAESASANLLVATLLQQEITFEKIGTAP